MNKPFINKFQHTLIKNFMARRLDFLKLYFFQEIKDQVKAL